MLCLAASSDNFRVRYKLFDFHDRNGLFTARYELKL